MRPREIMPLQPRWRIPMTSGPVTFLGGPIFDGIDLRQDSAVRYMDGKLAGLVPEMEASGDENTVDLGGDILSPGYVDLQVNGGGGVMFNDAPSVDTLHRILTAHRNSGALRILPTLITDTLETTKAAIAAAIAAVQTGLPGIAGLHLEGPHLSVARKGAHDPALIRPMTQADLDALLAAASMLPCLKVTIAPESVTEEQVRILAAAGVLVSLGHSDADFVTCLRYTEAGARCATHLFNGMSPFGSREPGLVGAVLHSGDLSAGLIADGHHVHPATLRVAWSAKHPPGRLFLVSDAMATAGSPLTEFQLGGRRIKRQHGRLLLDDGTLAGADLDLTAAIRFLVNRVGISLPSALQAATSSPAALIGKTATLSRLDRVIRIAGTLDATHPASTG